MNPPLSPARLTKRRLIALAGIAAATTAALLAGTLGGAARAATANTAPIALPASLGGFTDVVQAIVARSGKNSKPVAAQRANQSVVERATVAAYSRAYGGAAAAYRAYADSGLNVFPWVIAVRAPAPGLTIGPIEDLKYLGLATPQREVETFGRVSCEVDWTDVTPAGKKPNPADELTVECERSGPNLTVFVGGGGFAGPARMKSMVAFANAAWVAVGAG